MNLRDNTRVDAEFICLALDEPDDVKKLRSLDLTTAWINEAGTIPDKIIFTDAKSRCDRYPNPSQGGASRPGIILDTNPPDTEHWWYQLAEVLRPPDMDFFAQPPAVLPLKDKNTGIVTWVKNDGWNPMYGPAENAKGHNRGFQYWLNQVHGNSEEWIRVFLMGMYGITTHGKPVFTEYNDDVHSSKVNLDPYRGIPLIVGLDFGRCPTAVFMQLTPKGQMRVLEELPSTDMSIRQFARDFLKPMLINKYGGMTAVFPCDPMGSEKNSVDNISVLQELRAQGINPLPAHTNKFEPRREAVAGFLLRMVDGTPGFLVDPRCTQTRKAFVKDYRFPTIRKASGGEHVGDRPEKLHPSSDLIDCIQYGCMYAERGDKDAGKMGLNISRPTFVKRGFVRGFTG
jgi:hypothetical protein